MEQANYRRLGWKWGLGFGFWTLLGILLAIQVWMVVHSANQAASSVKERTPHVGWPEALRLGLAEAYLWAGFALFIFWLSRRWPFEQGRRLASFLIHLPASVLVALLEASLSTVLSEWLRRDLPRPFASPEMAWHFLIAKFHSAFVLYWLILGVGLALNFHRKYRERELLNFQLQARLTEAQLQVLEMQLHPHFLFNTLHAISALMHQDIELADQMIARLGQLLRATLENSGKQEVSLREELEFIEPYLEIQQARFGPRLTVQVDIDPETMDARVPNLLLQPLVENAIRHGIAPRAEGGRLEIRSRRHSETLQVLVADDGPGLDGKANGKEGVGLGNTRARLEHLYGSAQRLELSNGPGCGLRVTITMPFREQSAGARNPKEMAGDDPCPDRG